MNDDTENRILNQAEFINQHQMSYTPPDNDLNHINVIRNSTFMALRRIFIDWKRENSISPTLNDRMWAIWLESFQKGQQFIQLKWNSQHWFHTIWIKRWALSNDTWPIWRADYIEMAKQENRRLFNSNSLSIHSISLEEQA